jgi:hypothetical protein
MRSSLDIPDALFRETKAKAAASGTSLRDFVIAALRTRLHGGGTRKGWRVSFGKATKAQIAEVDAVIAREFGTVDPADWQ